MKLEGVVDIMPAVIQLAGLDRLHPLIRVEWTQFQPVHTKYQRARGNQQDQHDANNALEEAWPPTTPVNIGTHCIVQHSIADC